MWNEGDRFTVICKRCEHKQDVTRNFGGGIRNSTHTHNNPAKCISCSSRQLEVF